MIRFDAAECGDLESAVTREWLLTNGIGGYASSSIIGLNTRRYHGLLVAAMHPPVGRVVLLSKMEETVVVDGRRYELSANRYPGATHPHGFEFQQEFRLDPGPVFTYLAGGVVIEKTVSMVRGENTTLIRYQASGACTLELRPLIAFRDYHSTSHRNGGLNGHLAQSAGAVSIQPYPDSPALHLFHNADAIEAAGVWYNNFVYERETERGLDDREDLYCPMVMMFELSTGKPEARVSTRVGSGGGSMAAGEPVEGSPFVAQLKRAADAFIVDRGQFKSVIAGYHWFSDWGRDTMIALPGLTLTTGRFDDARGILRAFAGAVDQGMLPNRFPDYGESPEYNTVDATLWFFEAVRAFLAHTGEYEFVRRELYPVLVDIVAWHVRGTRYGIHVDEDGLLEAGAAGVQLTWMDAKVGDWVVTPRAGKPVEIQALWYNALCVMEELAGRFGDAAGRERYAEMARRAMESFNAKFWNADEGCLYDVVSGDGEDAAVRPNQIFAVSLPHTMLGPERAKSVVEMVRRDLLTPYGLRTLSPRDSRYRPCYGGDPVRRDGAYHQGTVWAWLMGPFVTAFLKVEGRTREARAQAAAWLAPFEAHLREAGLGHISEIFDGDAPHCPRGCIAQAWSAAEILRVAVEEVYGRG